MAVVIRLKRPDRSTLVDTPATHRGGGWYRAVIGIDPPGAKPGDRANRLEVWRDGKKVRSEPIKPPLWFGGFVCWTITTRG